MESDTQIDLREEEKEHQDQEKEGVREYKKTTTTSPSSYFTIITTDIDNYGKLEEWEGKNEKEKAKTELMGYEEE